MSAIATSANVSGKPPPPPQRRYLAQNGNARLQKIGRAVAHEITLMDTARNAVNQSHHRNTALGVLWKVEVANLVWRGAVRYDGQRWWE